MTVAEASLRDPYTRFRRALLTPEEVRELSRLKPGRVALDVAFLWLQILAVWAACALWTEWWVVLLAIPIIGTRNYALHVIGHDGIHRRLFVDPRRNDLFNDLFILGPEGAITRLNGQNHLLHHRLLANDADPDRHKYSSSNKTTALELIGYLTGLAGLAPLWRNVFRREAVRAINPTETEGLRRGGSYKARDLAILAGWQVLLIGGLTWAIGWWAYPVLWLLPVYVFTYCGDQIRFFLEHAHPEPDDVADEKRLITYTSNPLERTFFAPMAMNYHATHHLWPSIPYHALARADAMARARAGADGPIWRPSYVGALLAYARALPLPECRRSEAGAARTA